MNFHVLSNYDIIDILELMPFATIVIFLVFGKLATRDSASGYKRSFVAKLVAWIVLLLFVIELYLTICNLINYPWDIDPKPSNDSMYREMTYPRNGSSLIWGFANDYQTKLISHLYRCVFLLAWTIYAFLFEKSKTSWWKKGCKFVAYAIISIILLCFSFHTIEDLGVLAIWILPSIALLIIARVKTPKNSIVGSNTNVLDSKTNENKEDSGLFENKSVEIDTNNQTTVASNNLIINKETLGDPLNVDKVSIIEQSPIEEVVSDCVQNKNTMYCKHCGKEITDDSKYCRYCGGKQDLIASDYEKSGIKDKTNEEQKSIVVPNLKENMSYKTKVRIAIYAIWVLLHSLFWLYGSEKPHYAVYNFFPFCDIRNYDFTEFLFYVVGVPLIIWTIHLVRNNPRKNKK